LAQRLDQLKRDEGRLTLIDREVEFLRYLRQNQPPYLDALYVLAKTIPPGSSLENIAMNRRGEVTLRGSVRTSQEVVDFRTKLVDSGFFSHVVIEEQTPTQDRQKVNLRVTAQWRPANARANLAIFGDKSSSNGTPAHP
jgi:Tfp pilus assembly protein PilN